MKKQRRIRALSIILIFTFILSSSNTVLAEASVSLSNIQEKGQYYKQDINSDTEKAQEIVVQQGKTEKALRKPQVTKPVTKETYSKDKEKAEKRTVNSKTYRLDDKTEVKEIYFEKIHYKDKDGTFKEIDNTLVENNESYENKANDLKVELPKALSKNKGITVSKDEKTISMYPIEGDFSRSAVAENSILYNDVFEGIDYQYTINSDRLKEDIILNHYVDKVEYKYEVEAKGLKLVEEYNTIRGYEQGKTEPSFIIEAPAMIDAAGRINRNLTISLDKKLFGRDIISVKVDGDWLKDPNTAYPVKIDPNITEADIPINIACAEGGSDDTNTLNNGYTYIGYDDGRVTSNDEKPNGLKATRTYVKFNVDIPKEATVTNATFSLYKYTNKGNDDTRVAYLYSIDEDFSISRVTWNNQPKNISPYDSQSVKNEVGYINWSITKLINDWNTTKPNNGFVLKYDDTKEYINTVVNKPALPSDYVAEAYVGSSNNSHYNSYTRPKISITYEYIDGVDQNMPFQASSVKLRPITENDINGKQKLDGILIDGLVKAGANVHYSLDTENSAYSGDTTASNIYKYPNSDIYSGMFNNPTTYHGKESNWQVDKEHIFYPVPNVLYRIKAAATLDGQTTVGYSDTFQKYVVQAKDTVPSIAGFYGVSASQIIIDNGMRDALLVEGNTIFIRNPKKNEGKAYTPAPLTDAKKREIDSALMARNEHCIYGFEPINLLTGNFYYEAKDASVSDYNKEFSIVRTYNAKGDIHDGYFGRRWDFNYNKSLSALGDGTIIFNKGDGNAIYYRKNADGSYYGPAGENLQLSTVIDNNIGYKISDGVVTYLFNKMGLLDSETDSKGNVTKLGYNENYKLISITAPSGKVFGITLNEEGRISIITLPDSHTLRYSYDDNGNLVSYIDAGGAETKYYYDEKSRMTYFTDAKNNTVTSNVYDSEDRVISQLDAKGKEITISYHEGYNESVDANGNKTQYFYDSKFRIIKTVYPNGSIEGRSYDDSNNLKTLTDALGHTTTYEYDSRGNKTKEIRFDGKFKTFSYDDKDNLTSLTDFSGNTSSMNYDIMGNLLKLKRADNTTFEYTYNDKNQITSLKDPEGRVYSYEYSGADISKAVDPKGNAYKYYYNPMGKVISVEDPLGKTTRTAYNPNGLELSTTLPNSAVLLYDYDSNGNIISITDGNNNVTTMEYNSLNRLTRLIDPLGKVTAYTYDANGNKVEELNARNYKIQYVYDSLNRLIKTIDEAQGETTYERDALGNIISVTDPKGNKSTYSYNYAVNKVEKAVGILGQSISHQYDSEGNLVKLTLPDGNVKKYKYDSLYRLIELTDINGVITNTYYDAMGKITEIKDSLGSEYAYEYDENGNLTKTVDQLGYETYYTYDSRNSLSSMKDAEGKVTSYSYTDAGELKEITDPLGNKKVFEYDLNGNLKAETSPNGNKKLYSYDALNRLMKVQDPLKNLTQYTYDGAGNVERIIDPLGHETKYEYTAKNLPAKITDAAGNLLLMNYDKNGNVTQLVYPNGDSISMSYDGENKLISTSDAAGVKKSYEYDAMGRLTKQADNAGNEISNTYDSLGRLIEQKDVLGRTVKYSYDLAGNIISKTEVDGNITTYEYDKKNRVVKVTDAEGKVTTLGYDGLDRLTEKLEPGNKIYFYEYDAIGNLIKTVDPLSDATVYNYDKDANLTKVTNSKGNSKNYEYDALNRLISFMDERGNESSFTYDARGSLIKSQDAMGNITQFKYDALNRLQMKVDALGFDTTYEYDSLNNLIAEIDPKGNRTSYEYNKHGAVTKITDALKGETQFAYDLNDLLIKKVNPMEETYSYSYDKLHRINSITDPEGYVKSFEYSDLGNLEKEYDSEGNSKSYTYDKMHRLLSEQNTAGHITTYDYNSLGKLNSVKLPNGNISFYEYDILDRVNRTIDPEGKATSFEYDSLGNITKVTKPGSKEYKFGYDEANNLLSMVNPLGETTSYTYNKNNLVETVTNPMGSKTAYSYNALNMVTEIRNPLGFITKYSYDKNGNVAALTDGNNNKTAYDYDELNRLIKVTNPLGQETSYGYDKSSNLVSIINGNGSETKYSYDKVGRTTAVTNALGETESYNYNPIGTVASYMKPDGSKISYNYDMLNRLVSKEYRTIDGKVLEDSTVSYEYDISGNRTSMNGEEGTTNYEYDKMGRLLKVTFATGEAVKYEYDELGRKSKVVYPDDKYVKYNYDSLDRLSYVENWKGEKTYYSYDNSGRRKEASLPNGTKVSYEYDAADRITKLTNTDQYGDALSAYEYQYDKAGNIVSEKLTAEEESYVRTYSYDSHNEIVGFTEEEHKEDGTTTTKKYSYSYDKAGNRIAVEMKFPDKLKIITYKYNAIDELLSQQDGDGIVKYEYDKNGNRTKKIMPGNKIEYFEYDLENRLAQITNPKGEVLTFGYDSDGNRLFSTYGIYFKPYKDPEAVKAQEDAGTDSEVPPSTVPTPKTATAAEETLTSNIEPSNSEAENSLTDLQEEQQNTAEKASESGSGEAKAEKKSLVKKAVEAIGEFFSAVGEGIGKILKGIADFFKGLFNGTKVKAAENFRLFSNNKDKDNGNQSGNSNNNGNGNGNGNSGGNGNGNGNGSGNGNSGDNGNNNGNGNGNGNGNSNGSDHGNGNGNGNSSSNGNTNGHSKEKSNNGLHLGWYKRADHPKNPDGMDTLDNISNYEIINYVNDVSLGNAEVLMTSDKDGNYTEAYTYGLDRISVDYLASDEIGKRDPLYYLYDGRGSVGQLTNSLGQVRDSYTYDPFGNVNHGGPLGNSEPHLQDFYAFNGEEYNISGLQYLRARYYEPENGRFLTRDSYLGNIEEPLSLNRYTYTMNNPLMYADPSGHIALMAGDFGSKANEDYSTVRYGSKSEDVRVLQQMLSRAGFNPGAIDGSFGSNTQKQLRDYQASRGLTVDGIAGQQTWNALLSNMAAVTDRNNNPAEALGRLGSAFVGAIKKVKDKISDKINSVRKACDASGGQGTGNTSHGTSDTNKYDINIYNYSWEDADNYINSRILGMGVGHKLYSGDALSNLPEEITYKKNNYTYTYVLDEYKEYFMGIEIQRRPDVTLKDGRVISGKMYEYKLAYTDEPKVLIGIIQFSPGELRGGSKGTNNPSVKNSIKVGQEAHRQLEAEGAGKWLPEQTIKLPDGTTVRKDGVGINNSNEVRIIKPDTLSGRAAAEKRADLMRNDGYDPTIDYYDPTDPRFQPGSPNYIGPNK